MEPDRLERWPHLVDPPNHFVDLRDEFATPVLITELFEQLLRRGPVLVAVPQHGRLEQLGGASQSRQVSAPLSEGLGCHSPKLSESKDAPTSSSPASAHP